MDKLHYANFNVEELFTPELVKLLNRLSNDLWALLENRQFADFMMTSQLLKVQNPAKEFTKRAKWGAYDDITDDEYNSLYNYVSEQSKLFGDEPELSLEAVNVWKRMNECSESLYKDIAVLLKFCQLAQAQSNIDDNAMVLESSQDDDTSCMTKIPAIEESVSDVVDDVPDEDFDVDDCDDTIQLDDLDAPDSVVEASVQPVVQEDYLANKPVWISDSSKFYHRGPYYHGLRDPRRVTKAEAEAMGKMPCKSCFKYGVK